MTTRAAIYGLVAIVLGLTAPPRGSRGADARDSVKRGEYLFHAAGCMACHTDTTPGAQPLAGGRAFVTPFGTFYSPNITPDPETGIGRWTDGQFLGALHNGERPDGAAYFPVFPFTSFTGMKDEDALAIKAYLFSLPPVRAPAKPHDLPFPISWRFLQEGWRLLYFSSQRFKPDPARDPVYNRGAYLVTAVAHCGECHTPRNLFGATDQSMALAGTVDGPDGDPVPNITPDKKTGIGGWAVDEIVELLRTGETPEQSQVKGAMREAVKDGLRYLNESDLTAIATYILAQPPIANKITHR